MQSEDQLRRAIAHHMRALRPAGPLPSVIVQRREQETRMAYRVGFAGLSAYRQAAQGELDKRADQLADRVDKIKERGLVTIGKHDKALDGIENQIDAMDAMVREGENGAPPGPLPGSQG